MYSCVDGLPHRLLETLFSLVLYRHRPIRLASLVTFPSGEGICAGDSVYVPSFLWKEVPRRGGGWLPQRGERECEGSGILVFQTILISLADSFLACQ